MKKIFYTLFSSAVLFLFLQISEVHAVEDKTAPVIEEIKVLTPEVAPGGKVKVQVKASDDVSGVKYIKFYFKSPSGNNLFGQYIFLDENGHLTNTYIIETKELSSYAELGDWKLTTIVISDHAGNMMNDYSYERVENISFNVTKDAPNDETQEVDDGFKAWEPQTNVALNKEFTIKFNMDIDISTILQKNIYITDSNGNNVPLMYIIDRGTNLQTSQVTIAPVGSYRVNSNYTLYIKDITSKSGQKLAYNTKMKFTTTK